MKNLEADIIIVGAGAAGLMSAIWAGKTFPNQRILLLDGSRRPGKKILIAGGGRCNVTHRTVSAADFAGSSRNSIKKVLRRFDVPQTRAFFAELGVELKEEDTGKLFPVTDQAKTVLAALINAVLDAKISFVYPFQITKLHKENNQFTVSGPQGQATCRKLILATGGKSIPKTGSDGTGYLLAQTVGHTLTPRLLPALVPLTLPQKHFITQLSGIAAPVTLDLWSPTQKKIVSFSGPLLCTHFGLSGPTVLDISRYFLTEKKAVLTVNWLPDLSPEQLDQQLQQLGRQQLSTFFRQHLPDRLVQTLLQAANLTLDQSGANLTRDQRKEVVTAVSRMPLPVNGSRGFAFAEVTAGGIPLNEIQLKTMESRLCPNLFLCGEICDVDGRIGGFNFQWAWSSGYIAGISCGNN